MTTATVPMAGTSLRNNWRVRRHERFMRLVDAVVAEKGRCRILDVGGTVGFWGALEDVWEGRPVSVTLVNLEAEAVPDARFESFAGDARALPFADHSFDVVHSNSVIEHVGRWKDMQAMAGEVRRLARHYFVQTPHFWFPVEPHFRFPLFHWLPEPVRVAIVRRMACGFFPRAETLDDAMRFVEDSVLLTQTQMAALFPDALIERERVALLTKSLIAIR